MTIEKKRRNPDVRRTHTCLAGNATSVHRVCCALKLSLPLSASSHQKKKNKQSTSAYPSECFGIRQSRPRAKRNPRSTKWSLSDDNDLRAHTRGTARRRNSKWGLRRGMQTSTPFRQRVAVSMSRDGLTAFTSWPVHCARREGEGEQGLCAQCIQLYQYYRSGSQVLLILVEPSRMLPQRLNPRREKAIQTCIRTTVVRYSMSRHHGSAGTFGGFEAVTTMR